MTQDDLSFPIGRFEAPPLVDDALRATLIAQLAQAPAEFRCAVEGLDNAQLDTPYREGGWTVRQVVHHVPDSHINGYVRFKLALTEETPETRSYLQAQWAELPEARSAPVDGSLQILEGLHARWVACLRALPASAFAKTLKHPKMGVVALDHQLALYAWHGRHHAAHITSLRLRKGWT